MKIQCDEEGKKAIIDMCDIALKVGGLQNLNTVGLVLNSIQPIPAAETPPIEDSKEEEK